MTIASLNRLDRDLILDLLIQRIVAYAYRGAVRDQVKLLTEGPTWPSPDAADVELHQWYAELNDESRAHVRSVVQDTAHAAVYYLLGVLDGTAGSLVEGYVDHLQLTWEAYDPKSHTKESKPIATLQLNPINVIVELQDMFQNASDQEV